MDPIVPSEAEKTTSGEDISSPRVDPSVNSASPNKVTSEGNKASSPRRYYVNKGTLWTLRQRVDHGLHIILLGLSMSLMANAIIFLTPLTLWSMYLIHIVDFMATIVVLFGVISIYLKLRD